MEFDLDSMIDKIAGQSNQLNQLNQLNNQSNQSNQSNQLNQSNNQLNQLNQSNNQLNQSSDYSKTLERYILIPKSDYSKVPLQTYVRYIALDGELKKGGKISKVLTNGIITTFTINRSNNKKYIKWTIGSDKIKELYRFNEEYENKKTTQVNQGSQGSQVNQGPQGSQVNQENKVITLENKVITLEKNNQKLLISSNAQNIKIQRLENSIQNIISHLKKNTSRSRQ